LLFNLSIHLKSQGVLWVNILRLKGFSHFGNVKTIILHFIIRIPYYCNWSFHVLSSQITDGRWHQTQFIFQTQDPNLLPIVEVY